MRRLPRSLSESTFAGLPKFARSLSLRPEPFQLHFGSSHETRLTSSSYATIASAVPAVRDDAETRKAVYEVTIIR